MHSNIRAHLLLVIPMALTMCGTEAFAKHRSKKKPPAEAAPSPAPETPPAAAAAAAPAPTPAPETPPPAATPTPAPETPPPAATSTPAPETPPPTAAAAPAPSPVKKDGVRFRGGISLGGGGEFVSGFTAGLGGIDGRLGVQINNLVGVYLQPHVSFGTGTVGGFTGATGTVAATALVDFTFINRIFVGAGAGYGIVNNPHGPVAHLRFGGYPVIKVAEDRARRKGLMLGADMRAYFTAVGPVIQMMATVGYEAF